MLKKKGNKRYLLFGFLALQVMLIAGIGYFYSDFDTTTQSSAYSKNQAVYSGIPRASITQIKSKNIDFSISSRNTTEHSWIGADESQVFWKQLTHSQNGSDWTIKLGKGGQIYSITTSKLPELIPEQRVDHGQWIDEIFQHVIPSKIQKGSGKNTIVDGDIHQAGYYTASDIYPYPQILEKSVYSPVFSSVMPELMSDPNSYSYITWPQHAHLPRTYKDNGMLMHQQIRDIGDGVIEITLVIDKWQGAETTAINVPWATIRNSTVPNQIISNPNGSYRVIPDLKLEEEKKYVPGDQQIGSWYALTNGTKSNSNGIGIVFEKEKLAIEGNGSYVRIKSFPTDTLPRTVSTVKRDIALRPGDSVFFRYYIVLGPLSKIQEYGNLLANHVQMGRIDTSIQRVGSINICPSDVESVPYRRGCLNNDKPFFGTERYFAKGSYPLFLIKDTAQDRYYVTDDPYVLSKDPTDGKTEYASFFGWAKSEGNWNKEGYVTLESAVPAKYNKVTRKLYVQQ